MLVNVKFMGTLPSMTNTTKDTINFAGGTLSDFLEVLYVKYGESLKNALIGPNGESKVPIRVNLQPASFETLLKDGDEVLFLQHIYGG